jgi:hypothetical protein
MGEFGSADFLIIAGFVSCMLAGAGLALWAKRDPVAAQKYDLEKWARILISAAAEIYQVHDQRQRYVQAHLKDKFPDVPEQDLRAVTAAAAHDLKLRQPDNHAPLRQMQPVEIDYARLAEQVAAELIRQSEPPAA